MQRARQAEEWLRLKYATVNLGQTFKNSRERSLSTDGHFPGIVDITVLSWAFHATRYRI